jgi:cell division protein ZapA
MTTRSTADAERTITLDVSLLGRDYKVACKEHERAELAEAVALLDRRMREIRDASKSAGTERIAVMAALNLAHELLRERNGRSASNTVPVAIDVSGARRRIATMHQAIDQALAEQDKLF